MEFEKVFKANYLSHIKYKDGKPKVRSDKDFRIQWNKPLVIIVNEISASASEIFAAAMQDYNRAVVIGSKQTYGKGTVQNVIPMENQKSTLKITTASYWRPSGKNIHRSEDAKEDDEWGVSPDTSFELKLTTEQQIEVMRYRNLRDRKNIGGNVDAELKNVDDPQLRNAIDYLESLIK